MFSNIKDTTQPVRIPMSRHTCMLWISQRLASSITHYCKQFRTLWNKAMLQSPMQHTLLCKQH